MNTDAYACICMNTEAHTHTHTCIGAHMHMPPVCLGLADKLLTAMRHNPYVPHAHPIVKSYVGSDVPPALTHIHACAVLPYISVCM